jgi:tRNA A-37 threonylcarbamoyl transferase component Bud32
LPAGLDLRLRVASAELLGLPWLEPLGEWDATEVAIRDIPVGQSRHLVRFVEADGRLWALKELPVAIARREYRVLRELEDLALSAVRTAGVVVQPAEDTAILVTHYLETSWQYRRLLMRVPIGNRAHRARLFDAIAALLVDLHRNGVFWGDCSLSNTLFMRDGQVIRAWLVDAETAELIPSLSDGQRDLDLEIMVENVLGGLLDVAARLELPEDALDQLLEEAEGVVERYEKLWEILHEEPVIGLGEGYHVEARVRRLNELGFAVDEVHLESSESGGERARLRIAVAGRTFHADQLRRGRRPSSSTTCGLTSAGSSATSARASTRPWARSSGSRTCSPLGWPGRTRRSAASATRPRPTAICSRCAGSSARRRVRTWGTRLRSRHWPVGRCLASPPPTSRSSKWPPASCRSSPPEPGRATH